MKDQEFLPEIVYKESYLITCCLYRLLPDELLVHFIRSVNFAALLYDLEDAHKMGAGNVINGFSNTRNGVTVNDDTLRPLHRKCFKVIDPIVDHTGLSKEEKIVQLDTAVIQCWQMIKKRKDVKEVVVLPAHSEVTLPPEFMVVCFLYGIEPVQLLQYFINRISIVRDLSSNHFCPEYNPCSAFVNAALDKYAPNHEPLIAILHHQYLNKMLLLNEEMKGEPDHQKRFLKFEELAREWAAALQKSPLKRGELSKYISQHF